MEISDLIQRVSAPATGFTDEGPDQGELDQILQAGMSAPDHGGLRPWRYIVIAGAARRALGELFASAVRADDPAAGEDALDTARSRPLRAPVIVAVVASQTPGLAVPVDEQLLAAGASAHQLVLAAGALGYGAVWLSGPFSYHRVVREGLGIEPSEKVAGLIYIGGVEPGALDRKRRATSRAPAAEITTVWTGAAPPGIEGRPSGESPQTA